MKVRIPDWLTKNISIGPRTRRPPSRWERRIAKAMQACAALCLVCFAIWRAHLHYQITRQFGAIRSAGLPTSPQELNRWYAEVPETSNAGIVLDQAFKLLRTFPDKHSNDIAQARLLDRRERWPDEIHARIAEYVTMNGESLAKAREGVHRPQCRYSVDLSYGVEADLPHLAGLKSLARAAGLRAALAVKEGRQADWSSDVRLMLQLATTLDHEPTLISQLVRDSIISMAVKTTERCLSTVSSDEAGELIKTFAGAVRTNAFQIGLIGERASTTPAFRLSRAEWHRVGKTEEGESPKPKPPPLAGRPNPFLWLSGFLERDLSFYLRAMETNIALTALPPPASLVATNVAEQLSDTARRRGYILSGMLIPSIARVTVRDATALAQVRLAQTALALECHRIRYGQLPENLADLTPAFLPALPADPFTGESLRYRRLDKGFIIYSVDRDGHNDGGREKPANWKSTDKTSYDITFTVER